MQDIGGRECEAMSYKRRALVSGQCRRRWVHTGQTIVRNPDQVSSRRHLAERKTDLVHDEAVVLMLPDTALRKIRVIISPGFWGV